MNIIYLFLFSFVLECKLFIVLWKLHTHAYIVLVRISNLYPIWLKSDLYLRYYRGDLINLHRADRAQSLSVADPEISKPGARCRRGRTLLIWECFDALSHIFYVFVVREDGKIDIVNTACWLQWKYMSVMPSKTKN